MDWTSVGLIALIILIIIAKHALPAFFRSKASRATGDNDSESFTLPLPVKIFAGVYGITLYLTNRVFPQEWWVQAIILGVALAIGAGIGMFYRKDDS